MPASAWGLLGFGLTVLSTFLGRLPGPQPRTIREHFERIRALDAPLPYRAARYMLFAPALACFGIALRGG
jgi:hypothetical protein